MHDCAHIMKNGKCAYSVQHKYLAAIFFKKKESHQNNIYDLKHLHPYQDVLQLIGEYIKTHYFIINCHF